MKKPLLLSVAFLMNALLPLGAEPASSLVVDFDFAAAAEDSRGTFIIPNGSQAQPNADQSVVAVSKAIEGSPYTLADVSSEGKKTFLNADPARKSYFESKLPPGIPGNDDFTVTLWVKPSSNQQTAFLAGAGTTQPTWFIQTVADGRLQIYFNGNAGAADGSPTNFFSSLPLRSDEWNHIAIVFDRNDIILLYVNGELDATSQTINTQAEAMPSRLTIGGPHLYADGKLGGVQLYRGKLGAEKIRKLGKSESKD